MSFNQPMNLSEKDLKAVYCDRTLEFDSWEGDSCDLEVVRSDININSLRASATNNNSARNPAITLLTRRGAIKVNEISTPGNVALYAFHGEACLEGGSYTAESGMYICGDDITVKNIKNTPKVDASSEEGGSVKLEFTICPNKVSAFSAKGSVYVSMPKSFSGRFELSAQRGSVTIEGPSGAVHVDGLGREGYPLMEKPNWVGEDKLGWIGAAKGPGDIRLAAIDGNVTLVFVD